MNDVIRLACERAADAFGDPEIFNAAGFSQAICKLSGLRGPIDGNLVRTILAGRPDITPLHGGAHFRLHWEGPRG